MKSKKIQQAAQEYLSLPADSVKTTLDLSKLSNAEYLVYVVGEQMKKSPRVSQLAELQKIAGEKPDVEVGGSITIDVILKQVEADDQSE